MLKYFNRNKLLFIILALGALLRIIFLFWGAELYYGPEHRFTNNDSFSFTSSFINLIELGKFTFDPSNPDAYFGRLPGYPLFWGIHYMLLGPQLVNWGVAFSQLLLDVLAIYLIYWISLRLSRNTYSALLVALIYATYPFIISWTTIIGTELLGTFLTILLFYWLLNKPVTNANIVIIAGIIAAAFYVREYLGILIVSAILYYYLHYKGHPRIFFQKVFLLCFVFGILYLAWPVRNYLETGRLVLVKTKTSGYHRFGEDVVSARAWMYSWTSQPDPYLDSIAYSTNPIKFPEHIFATKAEKAQADALVELSRKCGSGFYHWKNHRKFPDSVSCNSQIEAGFTQLQQVYADRNPLTFYLDIPLKNLRKAIFKLNLNKSNSKLFTLLFVYRTSLILLALAGVIFSYNRRKGMPILFFWGFMYFFICFILRQVEMRYLLQADVALLPLTALFFNLFTNKLAEKPLPIQTG